MMNDDEDNKPQHNYGKSALRDFLENLNNGGLPEGWRESPLGRKAYEIGHRDGYTKGYQEAWEEAEAVIGPIRSILRLHDRSHDDHFDE